MPVGQGPPSDAALLHAVTLPFLPAPSAPIGVAVSGGSDSLALLHLMHRAGHRIEAVTVNHGLRPESGAEAAAVAAFCAARGLAHRTLHWSGPQATGNLMDQARRARLSLMAAWARERGIGTVVLGHTADDQAETLLMGLARKAGLDGLSGMRPGWWQEGVFWRRPLLSHSRRSLQDYLRQQGVAWAEDPTNEDAAFTRVRARRALRALAPLGISVAGLAAAADHLASARQALAWAVADQVPRVAAETAGALRVDRAGLLALPAEMQRRLLSGALLWLSGADHAPRAAELGRALQAVEDGRDATLWGCRIKAMGGGVLLAREPRAVAAAIGNPWDGRWHVTGPAGEVRALGAAGLRLIGDWRATGLPRAVLEVTPAIWQGPALIAAPAAGFGATATATVRPAFASFLISH